MTAADELDAQVYQCAALILVTGGPSALARFQEISRFERLALELEYAIRHTNRADMAGLLSHLASDGGTALVRRISNLWDLARKIVGGTVNELEGMLKAYSADRLKAHLDERTGRASMLTADALSDGTKSLSSLVSELMSNPSEAAPKLLVLVLSSVAVSGGVDGNGGVPDMDIPLMGIGAHRSPFTHSIIVGSLLETALLLVMRIILSTHKNLPVDHDPIWEGIVKQSVGILNAAGKGASIGIAYHLMVDAVVQPGTYHDLPFDMPLEAHQAAFGANSVAEASAVRSYPDEEAIASTPEILAAHKKYRATQLNIPPALRELLSATDIAILMKYGSWLQALTKQNIPPTTFAQVRFLNVSHGWYAPVSDHEKAWMALAKAKLESGWVTPIS